MWDDQVSSDPSAPQPIPPRGAWRAPSAALSQERPSRRAVPGMAGASETVAPLDDDAPVPRRTNLFASRTPWWRPRTSVGRILLGTAVFLLVALTVTVGVITRNFLSRDPHFRIAGVSSIQSTGLSEVNRNQLLPVFGEDVGRNIFFVPLAERRKQLEAIPWVRQATVMRFLPDRLHVDIIERTPVAFVRQGQYAQQVELADADGVILSMPPTMLAQKHYSFPVITGIDAKDAPAVRRARMAVYQRFVTELDQNKQHLTAQVSEIDLSDPEDLRATMPEQGTDVLAHFGEDHFLERLDLYHAHIAEWRQRYPNLIGVDLRYNGEVPLEMASASDSPAAARLAANGSSVNVPIKPLKAAGKSVSSTPRPKTQTLTLNQKKALDAREKAIMLRAAKAKAAREKALLDARKRVASSR